jgi:UDP-N-acetylmuramate dehydrogenase
LKRSEIEFSYRHSDFNPGSVRTGQDASKQIVTAIEIKLSSGDKSKIAQLRVKNLEHRKAAQPLQLPSAGSVFKNPAPDKAAWQLLEQLGLKGTKLAGAQISEQHANWIVNPSRQASSEDVRELIQLAKSKVKDHFGFELQNEIIFW